MLQSHNLETLTGDINMPNGFENPYIETVAGDDPLEANAIIQYLSGLGIGDSIWVPSAGAGLSAYEQHPWFPIFSTGEQAFDVNLPQYQYSGMNPEIMSALENVFNPGEGTFAPQEFGMDVIQQQIEDQLGADYMMDMSNFIGDDQWTAQDAWDYFMGITSGEIDYDGENLVGSGDRHDFSGFLETSPIGSDPALTSFPWHEQGSDEWYQTLFDIFGTPTIEGDIGGLVFGDTFESALPFTNVFDPESIANTLSQLGAPASLTAAEIKALTPEMIEKTTSAYYEPYEETQRDKLVSKLGEARGKAQTGGFAGSGARTSGLSGAEKLYRGGYENILADIMKMRGKETENVLDTIFGWQELLS